MAVLGTGPGGGFQFVTIVSSDGRIATAPSTRKKHIVYLSNEVPNKEYDTVLYTAFLTIRGLRDAGFDVTVMLLPHPTNSVATPEVRQRWLDELDKLNVGVLSEPLRAATAPPKSGLSIVSRPLRKLLWPRIADHFPLISYAPKIAALVETLRPDIVVYWGNFHTIAACVEIENTPFVAIVGEPPHLREWYRIRPPFVGWRIRFTLRFWRQTILILINKRLSLRLLKKCPHVWCTVTYLSEWYRDHGIAHCQHVRNIVPDWGGADWRDRRAAAAPAERLKIVLMGALGGTSTLAGYYFLAREILPNLDALFGGKFEIHICGNGELPPELERQFKRPGVIRRGFVDDIISELLSCDVFLVPTPIELGSRVRIAYAWSVGCCVVSHSANAIGLEEMQNGQNALLASSGLEVAKAIVRIDREPELRQMLQNNGRETFERYYSETATVDKIITKVEDVIQSSRFASRSDSLGKQSEVGI